MRHIGNEQIPETVLDRSGEQVPGQAMVFAYNPDFPGVCLLCLRSDRLKVVTVTTKAMAREHRSKPEQARQAERYRAAISASKQGKRRRELRQRKFSAAS